MRRPVRSGQVRRRAPTSPARPAVDRRDGGVDLRLGQRPLVVREARAGRRGSSRRRPSGRRGRCRRGSTDAGAGRRGAGWPPRPRPRAASSATTTARSRSTAGWRDGVATARHAGLAAGQAGDRELGDDDPLGPQLERVATSSGCSSPTRPTSRPPAVDSRPPGRGAGSGRRRAARRRAPRQPSRRQISSRTPFASSRSYGARRPVPGRRLGRRRSARSRGATTRASVASPVAP